MTFRVLGAGAGRTGNTSLREALEVLLGESVYHMWEVIPRPDHIAFWHRAGLGEDVDFVDLFEGWGGTVDWPASLFMPELIEAFPDALVLLSVRDSESWWRSADATVLQNFRTRPENRPIDWFEMIQEVFKERFTNKFLDQDEMIAAFEEHNRFVQEIVPPERLLVWRSGDGWEPICERLGLDVPAQPFPHLNESRDWRGGPPDVELRKR